MKVVQALLLVGSASAIRMAAVGKTDSADAVGPCGGKFADLIPAQKKYVNSMHRVWNTDYNRSGFGEFKKEMQCWATRLVAENCGGATQDALRGEANHKWLRETCTTNSQKVTDWYQVWKKLSPGFKKVFTTNFPGSKQTGVDGKGRWKMQALMDFGGKLETICASYCFCADDKGKRNYGEKVPFCGA